MSDPAIRPPRADETSHMTQLCLASKKSLGYSDDFMAQCVEELTITPQALIEHEFWVYAPEDIIQGIVCLKQSEDVQSAEISTFFIDAQTRGTGIGRKLWEKITERVAERAIRRLHLSSEPLSVGFYEKLGFQIIGEVPSGSIAGRMLPKMERVFARETLA